MMKIDEDDEFNRNDKKFMKIKMISSISFFLVTFVYFHLLLVT